MRRKKSNLLARDTAKWRGCFRENRRLGLYLKDLKYLKEAQVGDLSSLPLVDALGEERGVRKETDQDLRPPDRGDIEWEGGPADSLI